MPLPLSELYGMLVSGLVRGEALAANTTLEFLRTVGFTGGKRQDDWGEIRFIYFSYPTRSADGQRVERRLRVPLLTLLPISFQEVGQAEYEFFLRITEFREGAKELLADIAPFVTEQASVSRMPRMRVRMTMRQSDLPAGLSSSLRRIEESSGEQH